MLLKLISGLFNQLGVIVLAAIIISKFSVFQNYILKEKLNCIEKTFFILFFGTVGIIGTYWGIPVNDAIANSRSIGVVVAGIIGGPAVGIGAGLIAGIHRMLIPIARFTAVACGISTITGGLFGGLSKKYIDEKQDRWMWGIFVTAGVEILQMGLILLISKPFGKALELVKLIFIPMTFINSFGVGIFLMIIRQIYDDHEKAGALKAQLALQIASETLPILRKGLNKNSAKKAAQIIYEATQVSAVSITNNENILAHIGLGDDHHIPNKPICTKLTKRALKEQRYIIAQEKESIECPYPKCPLKAVIVVPLTVDNIPIGTLKLYKNKKNSITSSDVELAKGLGELFSTQLELSKIDYQNELLNKAELKALQAQIQPHFLFNALNTIISFCRTDPSKARELLLKLSYYLRTQFKNTDEFIPLEQEINYIKAYLSIEEARFSDRLKVIYDIDSDIECKVPPLLLQPIVENSLKHGLLSKKEGGIVKIIVRKEKNNVLIQIRDNGVGIDSSKISDLLNNSNKEKGIGISNVNARLKSIYGTQLEICSDKGRGTVVTIKIPMGEVEK
ncbi:sensor histidine kinase [Defluviitalea phaphyphila]|uniref:sensor histidine kinase n=1 Tax=Defluviitalea phaphyphila TaxID=1473580 RepID=UPI0007313531|nr:sensor histidine kinase [Defluviitalea phaphyphila]